MHEQVFSNSGKDLVSIVKEFLKEAAEKSSQKVHPQIACFAVAGPVDRENNTCDLTNLKWYLDGNNLAKQLGIEEVTLMNDFAAVGYGVRELKESDFKVLQDGDKSLKEEDFPIGVIGAGTGLGEAFILRNETENTWNVYPTEGGHVEFAARSLEEFELREYIQDKYKLSRVSVERIVSGPGIVAIYQFLRDCKRDNYSELEAIATKVKIWEEDSNLSKAPAEIISNEALKGDRLCKKTMQMFTEAYGSEVGNFALKLLPYRGLYIAGGIASKIFINPKLEETFLKELRNKGRMEEKVIKKIPIYLVTNLQVGLIGATYYARHKISPLSRGDSSPK